VNDPYAMPNGVLRNKLGITAELRAEGRRSTTSASTA